MANNQGIVKTLPVGAPQPGPGSKCDDDSQCPDGYTCQYDKSLGYSTCQKEEDQFISTSPCEGKGGYKGKNVRTKEGKLGKWILAEPCKANHLPKQAEDGTWWCCPEKKIGCQSDADCGANQTCVDGVCVDKDVAKGCPGGYRLPSGASRCEEREGKKYSLKTINNEPWCCPETTPEEGENPCAGAAGYKLTQDVGFPGGAGAGVAEWPETPGYFRSADWEAHYLWDPNKKKYVLITNIQGEGVDLVCKKGYTRTKNSTGEDWCCSGGEGGGGGGGGGAGGQFGWSSELQSLINRVMERANYLLDYPRGLTPEERQAVINYAVEGVRKGERGAIQSKRDELARMGLLGTGFELTETEKVKRGTREAVADIRRELAIDELNRRFQEITGTTSQVGGLLNLLLSTEQIPEVLSAARRSEGYATTNALLNYLSQLMGGSSSQYWNAILAQLMGGGTTGGSSSSIWDWLPWLSYLVESERGGKVRT